MILYAEALEKVLRQADARGVLPSGMADLADAPGRVLAGQVVAHEALPAFDNSSMDGYAVRAADTERAPVKLAVVGSVLAGDRPRTFPHGAVEIATGAPMPAGFDAVVRVEDARRAGGAIELSEPAGKGDYVRYAGTDMSPGRLLADAGERLDARHVLAFAALGLHAVEVRRRLRVALISTGSELTNGQLRNSTAPYLAAAYAEFGAEFEHLGTVPDDEAAFLALARKAMRSDVLLTTGAVSMGPKDFVTEAVRKLGAKILFHKAAIRPGKPILFATVPGGPDVFALPGNPLSTVVGFRFFVVPYLRRRLGQPEERPRRLRLAADAPKPAGLRCFFKARVEAERVRLMEGQASFRIEPLLRADAWAVLPEAGETAKAGELVDVYSN
jgi:molybdopterin molybdotransferase